MRLHFLRSLSFSSAIALSLVAFSPGSAVAQCSAPVEPPASQSRVVDISEWQVSFAIPENYQTLRSGSVIEVLSPSSYASVQCSFVPRPSQTLQPYGVSVAIVDGVVSETTIRSQLSPGQGTYLGMTAMPSGAAYMHTTSHGIDLVHLSLPIPGEAATIVFTANTDSTGAIYQETVLETILESFEFWL